MEETRIITTAQELKVLGDPRRLSIVYATINTPNKEWFSWELAKVVGLPWTSIYYHLKILVKHGFLIPTLDGVINGVEEMTYRAAHSRIEFSLGQADGRTKEASRGRRQVDSTTPETTPSGPRCRSTPNRVPLM